MRYLFVASRLGFAHQGRLSPGGLEQAGRCVARALASSRAIEKLGVWSQVEQHGVEPVIRQVIGVHAHSALDLEVRVFGGSRLRLMAAVGNACRRQAYDRVMYMFVNQAVLSMLPRHPPYAVWEIGVELFQRVSWSKRRALRRTDTLLSISHHTAKIAVQNNPGLPDSRVVHLCLEPPLFVAELQNDPVTEERYRPAERSRAVLIVGSMFSSMSEYLMPERS